MKIKTICPVDHGGCGAVHYLEIEDEADEELKANLLKLAGLVGCPACSIYQESKHRLEDVVKQNQSTIWERERVRDNAKKLLQRKPSNQSELEARVAECETAITCARGDLGLALREMARLDQAKENA